MSSEFLAVDPGYVCGIIQDGVGYRKGEPVIRLHMEAYLGSPETYDSVEIEGSPSLSMKIAGGIHGDVATASIAVNSIPKVLQARARPSHDARPGAAVVLPRTRSGAPLRVPAAGLRFAARRASNQPRESVDDLVVGSS